LHSIAANDKIGNEGTGKWNCVGVVLFGIIRGTRAMAEPANGIDATIRVVSVAGLCCTLNVEIWVDNHRIGRRNGMEKKNCSKNTIDASIVFDHCGVCEECVGDDHVVRSLQCSLSEQTV
jgi:hypothetical protein